MKLSYAEYSEKNIKHYFKQAYSIYMAENISGGVLLTHQNYIKDDNEKIVEEVFLTNSFDFDRMENEVRMELFYWGEKPEGVRITSYCIGSNIRFDNYKIIFDNTNINVSTIEGSHWGKYSNKLKKDIYYFEYSNGNVSKITKKIIWAKGKIGGKIKLLGETLETETNIDWINDQQASIITRRYTNQNKTPKVVFNSTYKTHFFKGFLDETEQVMGNSLVHTEISTESNNVLMVRTIADNIDSTIFVRDSNDFIVNKTINTYKLNKLDSRIESNFTLKGNQSKDISPCDVKFESHTKKYDSGNNLFQELKNGRLRYKKENGDWSEWTNLVM